jgi:hypothetical protein
LCPQRGELLLLGVSVIIIIIIIIIIFGFIIFGYFASQTEGFLLSLPKLFTSIEEAVTEAFLLRACAAQVA